MDFEIKKFIVDKDTNRLDIYISEYLKLFSRNQIKIREVKAFKEIDNSLKEVKLSKPVFKKDKILIKFNKKDRKSGLFYIKPSDISIEIIYEDMEVIVLDKPPGVVTHPGISNYENTIINFLFHYIFEFRKNFKDEFIRPGIVHRLDKDTSGVIIIAKNLSTLNFLSKQFKEKTVKKVYLAIIKGKLKDVFGVIDVLIDRDKKDRKKFRVCKYKGKHSITEYRILFNLEKYSLIALKPKTGRTHQLRVHMKYMNTPILGDLIYSKNDSSFKDISLMLHSYKLEIDIRNNYNQKFVTKIPERFINFLLNFYSKKDLDIELEKITKFLDSF